MRISIFGLGYVGCVSMACLARNGHHIIGVDVNPDKVESIGHGKSPIIEPGLAELIQTGVAEGRIEATGDVGHAIRHADIAFVCVGTPSKPNGDLELKYVDRVCQDIGRVLANTNAHVTVVVRSTILPGVARERLIPILESRSGRKAGQGFASVCIRHFHPVYTDGGQIQT